MTALLLTDDDPLQPLDLPCGSYWKPVYNLLEASFVTWVVNPHHMNVPGRKTDVKDAEWSADLLLHGLLTQLHSRQTAA